MNKMPHLDQQRIIEELEVKQKNTLWPDTLKNSRAADEFLWKGSPDAPLVQRMGAWIFGIFFLLAGAAFVDSAYEKHSPGTLVLSFAWFLLGIRVCLNGFKKHKSYGEAS